MPEINEQINDRIADTEEVVIIGIPEPPEQDEVTGTGKGVNLSAAVKKTRTRTTKPAVSGKVDAKSVVEGIGDQIKKLQRLQDCIGYIGAVVQFTDIPPDLEKAERDTLLGYMKEVEAIQGKYIKQIQQI